MCKYRYNPDKRFEHYYTRFRLIVVHSTDPGVNLPVAALQLCSDLSRGHCQPLVIWFLILAAAFSYPPSIFNYQLTTLSRTLPGAS